MVLKENFNNHLDFIYDNTKIGIRNGARLINGVIGSYELKFKNGIRTNQISSFSAVENKSGLDEIRYIFIVNNVKKYFNGSSWVNSDGSYLQANTLNEVSGNISSLVSSVSEVGFIVYLYSNDGTTTPELLNITVNYVFKGEPQQIINYCLVWGYLKDDNGNPLSNKIVSAVGSKPFFYKDTFFPNFSDFVLTDSDGLFMINLIETDSILDKDFYYNIYLDNKKIKVYVPNKEKENINNLKIVN